MNRDLHPEFGARVRLVDIDACLVQVKATHPAAHAEGSMGAERSFWVNGQLVAHAWPVKRHPDAMWLRVCCPCSASTRKAPEKVAHSISGDAMIPTFKLRLYSTSNLVTVDMVKAESLRSQSSMMDAKRLLEARTEPVLQQWFDASPGERIEGGGRWVAVELVHERIPVPGAVFAAQEARAVAEGLVTKVRP